MPPVPPGGNIFRLQLRGPFKAHGGAKKGQIYGENHDGAGWRVGWLNHAVWKSSFGRPAPWLRLRDGVAIPRRRRDVVPVTA